MHVRINPHPQRHTHAIRNTQYASTETRMHGLSLSLSLSLSSLLHTYAHVCTLLHTCTHVCCHTHTFVRMLVSSTQIHAYTYKDTDAFKHTHTYAHLQTHSNYTWTFTHTYTIHTQTHTHTHTCSHPALFKDVQFPAKDSGNALGASRTPADS